jgi:WhiB family transcriptional regulator, redox-sensing transcriptional regulator
MSDDWRHDAACRDEDPDLHFPLGTSGIHAQQIEAAKAVCRRCPVQLACLDWAADNPSLEGIWGGLMPGERRNYRRRQHRATAA